MTAFRVGAATDVGRIRQSQQDAVLVDEEKRLFGVADGMGGHRGGEVASHVAVETLQAEFGEPSTDALVHAVQAANDAVVRRADGDPDLRGMGTTMCAMALVHGNDEDRIGIVNVGDSRCYLFKHSGDSIDQITEDHSLVETLVRQGQLTEDDAANHPHRNILTRALGIDSHVMVDSWELLPFTGDRYLMCSDGLFNEVDEATIAEVLGADEDPAVAAEELVRLANAGGGRDNITVLVVDVIDDKGRRAAADEAMGRVMAEVHGNERVTGTLGVVTAPVPPDADGPATPAPPADGHTTRAEAADPARPAAPAQVVVGPGSPVGAADEAAGVHAVPAPRSRFTWRVAVFVVLVLGVFAAVGYAVVYFADNTYFVGLQGEQVVVYRGRPGGILWIEPEVAERTELTLAQVPEARRAQLVAGRDEPTLEDARRFVANLRSEAAENNAGSVPGTTPGSSPTTGPPGGAAVTTSTSGSLGGAVGAPEPSR